MLSVRLSEPIEARLLRYCADHGVSKSQVVQQALSAWLDRAAAAQEPDLSFLAPDDPIRQFIGIAKGGMTTDELMRMTRGDDWNQP